MTVATSRTTLFGTRIYCDHCGTLLNLGAGVSTRSARTVVRVKGWKCKRDKERGLADYCPRCVELKEQPK